MPVKAAEPDDTLPSPEEIQEAGVSDKDAVDFQRAIMYWTHYITGATQKEAARRINLSVRQIHTKRWQDLLAKAQRFTQGSTGEAFRTAANIVADNWSRAVVLLMQEITDPNTATKDRIAGMEFFVNAYFMGAQKPAEDDSPIQGYINQSSLPNPLTPLQVNVQSGGQINFISNPPAATSEDYITIDAVEPEDTETD